MTKKRNVKKGKGKKKLIWGYIKIKTKNNTVIRM